MGYSNSLITILLLLCTLQSGSAIAQDTTAGGSGAVRGRIVISRMDDITEGIVRGRMLNRYGGTSGMPQKPLRPYTISEKAVVYIEKVPGSYSPPRTHPILDQHDMVFRPLVLPILVGTTVDFPNSDPLFHNVFSLSSPKEFDLGRYPQGQHRSVTFNEQGVVSVYCEIHSYMFATILVLQNPYFAVPDQDGNFEITGIPPGTYQMSLWYGRKKIDTKTVTITANETTNSSFEY